MSTSSLPRKLLALAVFLALTACAFRVAPVGDSYTKPDGKGGWITSFNPDLPQPKDDPNAGGLLAMLASALPGPWGYIAASLVTLGGGLFAGRKETEGTIGRISAGVQAFIEANPAHAPQLLNELSKSMDRSDKKTVRRVKPSKSKPAT